jgi:hypothetical protein
MKRSAEIPSSPQQSGRGIESSASITLDTPETFAIATVIGTCGAAISGIVIKGCVFVIFTVFDRGGAWGKSGSTLMRAVSFFGSARSGGGPG